MRRKYFSSIGLSKYKHIIEMIVVSKLNSIEIALRLFVNK